MNIEYEKILESALTLPRSEFFALLQALLGIAQEKMEEEKGESPFPGETDELFDELDKRLEEILTGKSKAVPGNEVMEKLRKRMA